MQLIFIELPKLPVHSPDEKKLKLLCLRFLREINQQTISVADELLDIPEIAKAVHLAEESAYSKAELAFYESYWDQVRRDKTLLIEKYEKGEAKGRAEGFAQGEAEGLAEGVAKAKMDMAKSFMQLNVLMATVMAATGLSEEEVLAIKG